MARPDNTERKANRSIEWNEQQITLLRTSYGKISTIVLAGMLGCSKSAVIGKAHRLGLGTVGFRKPKPGPVHRPKRKPGPPRQFRPPPPPEESVMPVLPDTVPPLHPRAYRDLEDGVCYWPVYMERETQMYCAAVTAPLPGSRHESYCPHHRIAAHHREPKGSYVRIRRSGLGLR